MRQFGQEHGVLTDLRIKKKGDNEMANQSHSSIQGDPFLYCGVCGALVRSSHLVAQRGLLRCTDFDCVDNLLVLQRSAIMKSVIQSGPDAPPAQILQEPKYEEIEDIII